MKIRPITLEDIDELTGDIMLELGINLENDRTYTQLHNFLKERLDPWREGNK